MVLVTAALPAPTGGEQHDDQKRSNCKQDEDTALGSADDRAKRPRGSDERHAFLLPPVPIWKTQDEETLIRASFLEPPSPDGSSLGCVAVVKRFLLLASAYVAIVVLANWLASRFTVSVGFGRIAPAGVFCIGGVLVLRDWLQQLRGLLWTMPLVYTAGLLSWGIGELAGWTSLEQIAVASLVAFTVSETVEAVVFTPVRKRSLTLGVALSATVGNALDSFIFLALAFGSQAFFVGQFIGKSEMIAAGTLLTLVRRQVLPASALVPASP